MKDQGLESELRAWIREAGTPEPGDVARVAAVIDRLPARQRAHRGWLQAAAALLAVVVVVVAGAGLLRLPASGPGVPPATPLPPDPAAFAGDLRLTRCPGGDPGNVLYAFEMVRAADYPAHLPAMLLSPELDVDVPAFVVVYRSPPGIVHGGAAPPRGETWAPRSLTPGSHDVCVLVGSDPTTAEINIYGNVDIRGLTAAPQRDASSTMTPPPPSSVDPTTASVPSAGATTPTPIASTASAAPTEASPVGTQALEGVERLVADLEQAGASVRELAKLNSRLPILLRRGVILCLDSEEISVYVFDSSGERVAVTAVIDPEDPTYVGEAIIEWAGYPRFWERDRIVVLYVGTDQETEDLLTSILGRPFARGDGPGYSEGRCG